MSVVEGVSFTFQIYLKKFIIMMPTQPFYGTELRIS